MMFSCEKQKTPSRPPLIVVSMMTPVSTTTRGPSKNRTLRGNGNNQNVAVGGDHSTGCIVHVCATWCSRQQAGVAGTSGRMFCPSSRCCGRPSTEVWPGRWYRRCATARFLSSLRGPSLIWQPIWTDITNLINTFELQSIDNHSWSLWTIQRTI